MSKEGFGKSKTREQIEESRRHGNTGGERREGSIFKHVDLSNYARHIARFATIDGHLACSVCGKAV
jgi:hypothetical protein